MRILLLLLPALLLSVRLAWSPPLTLFTSDLIFLHTVYTDRSTGTHHLLHAQGDDKSILIYSRISPNGTLLSHLNFTFQFANRLYRGTIAGADNGHDLFVRLSPRRVCPIFDLNLGCEEPYLMESHDDGQTWSEPARIVRPFMDDVCSRSGENIVLERSTGRVWVFYAKHCGVELDPSSVNSSIAYVFKEPNGTTYSEETIIHTIDRRRVVNVFSLQTAETPPQFRLFWADKDADSHFSAIFTMSSPDGKVWTPPRSIYRRLGDPPTIFWLAQKQEQHLIMLGFNGTHRHGDPFSKLLWTKDFFHSVSITNAAARVDKYFFNDMQKLQAFAVCGPNSPLRAYMLTELTENSAEYRVWDLDLMVSKREQGPFADTESHMGVELSCYVRPDGATVVSAFQALESYPKSVLKFCYRIYLHRAQKSE